ncbi:hypothetical protein ACFZCG_01065 [Streptomyces tanashiensis]|uniref:hypothetical protein n=1 Tax=Streptomyces tanashiensis TaxID=67367 RepID=UPI0036E26F9C
MRRIRRAVVAVAVIALGSTGCGKSDTGIETTTAPAPAQPRPKGTGPLAKEFVRTDLASSAADGGVPANDHEYARPFEEATAGSPPWCAVAFRGIGDKKVPLDFEDFKAVVGELRERDWRQSGGLRERETLDGVIGDAVASLGQRGWSVTAQ